MSSIPAGATHTREGAYYRKARGGAYYWCRDGGNWRYMEDKQARFVLKHAQALEKKA